MSVYCPVASEWIEAKLADCRAHTERVWGLGGKHLVYSSGNRVGRLLALSSSKNDENGIESREIRALAWPSKVAD